MNWTAENPLGWQSHQAYESTLLSKAKYIPVTLINGKMMYIYTLPMLQPDSMATPQVCAGIDDKLIDSM